MGLFQDTKYFLATSLPTSRQEQLDYALSRNGAIKADSITRATHIITNSAHFQGSEQVQEGIFVVSDYWVDRSLVLGKLQAPQHYSVDPGMLFSGIIACATEQLPIHDLEVLSAGITALGGQWRVALTSDVTHLFAISPNSTKYTTALAHRESTGVKALLPHWFDDSVRLGMRNLPVEPYLWPDPPHLKDIGIQNVSMLGAVGKTLEDKAKKALLTTVNTFTPSHDSRVPLPKDVDLVPVKKNVWSGKRILLSWTLSLYGTRREAVEAGIRRAGGEVLRYPTDDDEDLGTEDKERRRDKKEARAVSECDILITRWRNGRAYGKAFRLHKTIGTMGWLYHVQSSGQMPRPVDQLLHYPTPRKPIENFCMHEITVTNYTGESREYIKKMISAMGARFTPSMTGKNTVLVAAYIQGTKAEKARAWSIPVVNHTWLEDCFIQWRHLTTATEKYIVFPPGIDFCKLLGERGVGVRGVELCDEEEAKEGESESEDGGMEVDGIKDEDEVLENGVEEDIDMISMPDTDDLRPEVAITTPAKRSPTKVKSNGNTKSARKISESVSPFKRDRQAVQVVISPLKRPLASTKNVTPAKAKSKSISPAKRRRIVNSDEDEVEEARMSVDHPASGEENEMVDSGRKKVSRAREPIHQNIEDDVVEFDTPSRGKKNGGVGLAKKKLEIVPDLELSDDEDTLDRTPEYYRSIGASAKGKGKSDVRKVVEDEEESEDEERMKNRSGKRKMRRKDSDDEEDEEEQVKVSTKKSPKKMRAEDDEDYREDQSPVPPTTKKKLVRRLTNEASLELAKEREKEKENEADRPSTRLVRRVNGKAVVDKSDRETEEERATDIEEENVADVGAERPARKDKVETTKTSLLKTTRGDARTRVKVKGAKAKARELYSDNEDEVADIVDTNPVKGSAKAKGKAKQEKKAKFKKGRKSRVVSADEESMPVESEDEDDQEDRRLTGKGAAKTVGTPQRMPLMQVSVVLDPPPSAKTTPRTYSSKGKGKARAVIDERDSSSSEDDEVDENEEQKKPASRRGSARQLKKTESVHIEAGEKATKLISSPVKAISAPASKPKSKHRRQPSSSKLPARRASSPLSSTYTPDIDFNEPPAKRGAAAKAEEKLKVMMPDATKFEAEMRKARKSGGGMKGIGIGSWERQEEEEQDTSKSLRKKRHSDAMDIDEETGDQRRRKLKGKATKESEDDEEVVVSVVKKGKVRAKRESDQGTLSSRIYLMTTQVSLPESVVKNLEKLGVTMTTKPSQCTHLLAPHLVRTEKFLCALAAAPHILESSWAIKSASAKQLLPEDNFVIHDEKAEAKYHMTLSEALTRAKDLRGTLFAGKTFYVTPKTKVDFKLLKSVVTAHSGQLVQQSPTIRMMKGNPDRHVVSCPEDISIWRPLATHDIPVYIHEFLLIGVLKQELEWDNEEFRVAGSVS